MLVSVVSASLLAPFTIVVAASWIAGVELDIEPLTLFVRLALLIGGCAAAALLARRLAGPP
ncbi:MAG: hypothetical protein GWO02_15610, partial [Gammaproteobacteria bacterium]|nr:hypothetical protein [Gammaproteobacteria bacterium]